MKVQTAALGAALVLAAPAAAATGNGGAMPMRAVEHVRKLEQRNAFHLRDRIGGAFVLGGAYCEHPTAMPLLCKYNATQVGVDADGKRTFCTIDVRVTRRGRHGTRWHRAIEVCATDFRPSPVS